MSTDTTKNKSCDYNGYKRVRYFHGMLLTERDFQEEQIYLQEKRRLHNRMLHGWGVVCGLGVKPTSPESSKVVITPGTALDCLGNEIVVCGDFEVDLKQLPNLCPDTRASAKNICAEGETRDCKYYIGIRYTEAPTDPVPVYVTGGSCEEKSCEYSRVREGFCVSLFKSPPCHAVLPKDGLFEEIVSCLKGQASNEDKINCVKKTLDEFQSSFCGQPYPCPSCCCEGEPYVILGSIDLTATKCAVSTIRQDMIDINDGRRYVMTPMFWQHYLGSLFNPLADFIENPFVQICKALSRITDQFDRIVQEPAAAGKYAAFNKAVSVNKMTEEQARVELANQNLVYSKTMTLSAATAPSLAARAVALEKVEPNTPVDLVTDSSGNVIFYIPAEEKIDVSGLRKEMEEKVAEMQKMSAEDMKKMETTYKTRLDEMSRTIKELKEKIR